MKSFSFLILFFLFLGSSFALIHCGGEDKPYDLTKVEEEEKKADCEFNIFLTADCVNPEKTPPPGGGGGTGGSSGGGTGGTTGGTKTLLNMDEEKEESGE